MMNEKATDLIKRIKTVSIKYYSWEAALELSKTNISGLEVEVLQGLNHPDPFVRECFLEVLASKNNPPIVRELRTLFQSGDSNLTYNVRSLARLRATAQLPADFYHHFERSTRSSRKNVLEDPLDLVLATPNILFPDENQEYAKSLISTLIKNPRFFLDLTEQDLFQMHIMFYTAETRQVNEGYRKIRFWEFDLSGSPVEPYRQTFVVPSSIRPLMESLLEKIREYSGKSKDKHPLQFIGESFFYQNAIHPFNDCNGRTNILLMNLFFLHYRMPYLTMDYDNLPAYYESLNHEEPTNFVKFLGNLVVEQSG
jgi:hypothetical protein